MSIQNTFASWEQYIIYLRKSRQDDPRETVEEVLEKHETMLQEYAMREFGHKIPEANIYREVMSGESISEREQIKEVLIRITDPNIKGVLVVEPSRLSRGDLTDCGHLIDALRYSKTQVVTPYMTYDLDNKMERKFFQDELLRGNDYLEYTKEILWRGRVAAAKRGCYSVGGPAPCGYKKVKVEKDWILEVDQEQADVVRKIYDWYITEDITPGRIGRRLDEMCVPSPSGEGTWKSSSIRKILSNQHYLGLIIFNRVKSTTFIDDGEKVNIVKSIGKIVNLKEKLKEHKFKKQICGIAHTRWATHGKVTEENSHPHKVGRVTLVHNGIIENYKDIEEELKNKYEFKTETDTEKIAALIDSYYDGDNEIEAIEKTFDMLKGSYALAVIFDGKENIYGVKKDAPLLLGIGEDEYFLSSDISAILEHTKEHIVLEDNEIVEISEDYKIYYEGILLNKDIQTATWNIEEAQKNGYDHFMLKEIYEQANLVRNNIVDNLS